MGVPFYFLTRGVIGSSNAATGMCLLMLPAFVFAIVSFIAINANTASNAGILGCTAVAAAVFASMGYNPWLGIILAYAAGNAGMSANVFVGNLDVLLSGIYESV